MDLRQLKEHLERLSNSLNAKSKTVLQVRLRSLISVFPFNAGC